MDSGLKAKDFDYIILNKGEIIGVRGEEKIPISEEDYRAMHPLHRDSGCKECQFVQDEKNLVLYFVSREMKENATFEPKFVGKFFMPGWSKHSSFYVFKCRRCEDVVATSPRGYHGEFMYLRCDNCWQSLDLDRKMYEHIYLKDDLHVPRLGPDSGSSKSWAIPLALAIAFFVYLVS